MHLKYSPRNNENQELPCRINVPPTTIPPSKFKEAYPHIQESSVIISPGLAERAVFYTTLEARTTAPSPEVERAIKGLREALERVASVGTKVFPENIAKLDAPEEVHPLFIARDDVYLEEEEDDYMSPFGF